MGDSDSNNFKFRPLTQGLGFDKSLPKKQNPKQHIPIKQHIPKRQNVVSSNFLNPVVRKNQIPDRKPLVTDHPTVLKKTNFEIPDKDFTNSSKLELEKISDKEPKTFIHQSPETFNQELPNPTPVSRSLKKMLESLPPSTDFKEDKKTDLDRKPSVPIHKEIPTEQEQNFDITLDNSLSKAFPREEVVKPFYHQKIAPVLQYKETSSSFASAIIDSLIIIGLSSLFVVSLVAITKVDIITMLTTPGSSTRVVLELVLLSMGVTLFYFMLARGLFGSTLGDWAFDIQLGSEKERAHILYPFQVIFRVLVIMVTGIFIIPVVSAAFGKDIAYYFSGLRLYCRQY